VGGTLAGWDRRHVARVALPALIVATAALAAWQLARAEENRRVARLNARAEGTVTALQRRLSAYTDVLYGVRGLFQASARVDRTEFHEHVAAVDVRRRFPGIRVVGAAELVPTDDTTGFVARVRRDVERSGLGYPRFAIKGRAVLERRLVIDYLEPQRGNEQAFGLDFFSEPGRRHAAERALETGAPSATAPVALVQDQRPYTSVLIFLPIEARSFTGTAYAAVHMADLMREVEAPVDPADVQLEDLGPAPGGPVSERARRVVTFRSGPLGDESTSIGFDVLGRHWSLRYAPRDAVISTAESTIPWIVLAVGIGLAALASWLLTAAARTERRAVALATRMTADLRAKEAELQRSNAELERFAYVASHDLREPLRSVSGFISLLSRRHGGALDPEARSWIGFALEGTERMNALIGDLLEYSRAGRRLEPGETPRADLELAWDEAVAGLAAAIEEAGATVTRGPLPAVAAEQREMNQVMQNLLGNAIKYRGDRAPVVHAEAERTGGAWAIAVQDNGIGIERHHQDRIFVLFQRLHTRDDYEGTGMGLSIVKKIVEARSGSITVASTPGEGSRFTVTLPEAAR
jgi:signal transduction histidine kinase